MPVPVKVHVLKKLEASHRETVLAFAALQQRAQVAVERAAAAEERLTWTTNEAASNGQENKENIVDDERLQQLMHENERLHAQLASARLQLLDHDRSTMQLKCRISELDAQLERAVRSDAASRSRRKQDEKQIKSLRATIRVLEKELIQSAAVYR